MHISIHSLKEEKGFVGLIFLAIAVIAIVIASISFMSRSKNTAGSESLKPSVSTAMKHMADFKSEVDIMAAEGASRSDIANFLCCNTPIPGKSTKMIKPIPPAAISAAETFYGPTPSYRFGISIAIPGVGRNYNDNNGYENVATLLISSLEACQKINNMLHGDSLTATPYTSGNISLNWSGFGVTDNDNAVVAANYRGRVENCIRAQSGPYVYYKVLIEN